MNKLKTNCCNCGAVMEYSKQYYGSMYKCPYCGTEHHIDLLGRIEEYKVKFMWMGKLIEAYLSSYRCEFDCVESCYIDFEGTHTVYRLPPQLTFEFIGRFVEDVDKGDDKE